MGTTPPGTVDEQQAAQWVRRMFSDVAPKYDLLNHLLSFNIDRSWRKALLTRLQPALLRADAIILDLCCGTGDVLLDLQSHSQATVFGADFCHPMLLAAKAKIARRAFRSPLFEADALNLPVRDNSLDAIAISFGFRNLANYLDGLIELQRVLRPGGMLAILEFSHPPGAFMKQAYRLYSNLILPAIGSLVSGSRDAYTYLPDSIRKFPKAEHLRHMMTQAGFTQTEFTLLTGGIAALHTGLKPQ